MTPAGAGGASGIATAPASRAETPVQAARRRGAARHATEPARWVGLALVVAFAAVPLAAPSFEAIDLAIKIAIFATLAASYDVLLGYTGIVSFGHAMFFGFGAYAVALAMARPGAGYLGLGAGLAAAIALSLVVSLVISAFSLRVKAIFFAMVTLAFAEFALILAVQLSDLTGGEDGLNPVFPGALRPSWTARPLGVPLTGRHVAYYVVLLLSVLLFAALSRFVRSPFGRTLQAIRDNALRAEALGIRTFLFQSIASSFASVVAALLGAGYVVWVGYANPDSVLGLHVMLDVLLMVVIGGIGTLWGGIIGAGVLLSAQTLLPDLRTLAASAFPGSDVAQRLTERWLLYFGVLFVLVVFFFPKGVLGTVRERRARRP